MLPVPTSIGGPGSGSAPVPITQPSVSSFGSIIPPHALQTPPSKELEGDIVRDEVCAQEGKGKNVQGKNVAFRDHEAANLNLKEAEKLTSFKGDQKSKESLHMCIGCVLNVDLGLDFLPDQRMEKACIQEQAEVVEMAIKAKVQNSVLPVLEHITRMEIRAALNKHVERGLTEFIQNSLLNEIEKLLLCPDISNHFTSILLTNLNPLIERYFKDSVMKNIIPMYSQQTSAMHQDILQEMRAEILNVKKDSMSWQTEAVRSYESLIKDLEHSIRMLSSLF
ncbi:hypothetical protein BD769DRAFT_1658548 [Suillus cothurnatus]|nr:hypothetical protein BD769DRAFT_1658548 [Suillus cothurnatus]